MALLKSKGSRKRPAETSSALPLQKKGRVLPDAAPKPVTVAEQHNDGKPAKKLAKGLQKKSAEISSASNQKTVQVKAKAQQKSGAAAPGQNNSKALNKLSKGSQKRSTEAPASPQQKKTQFSQRAHQKSATSFNGQKRSGLPKKWTKFTPDKRKNALQVLVRHIPKSCSEADLEQRFSQFGNIECINQPADINDRSTHRGFAFIQFRDELARDKALAAPKVELEVNGETVSLRVIKCKESGRREVNHTLQVLVSSVPKEASRDDLEEHFSKFGGISLIVLPKKFGSRTEHKGFAYVEFVDELAKKKALKAGRHKVKGQVVSVLPNKAPEPTKGKEVNHALEVFVHQIPKKVSKEDLEKHFSQFGNLKRVALPTKLEDRSAHKGFAFVEFADKSGKKKALAVDKHEVDGQVIAVRALKPSESVSKKDKNCPLEVFIGQIPKEVGKLHLKKHFSQFGSIKSITLPTKADDRSAHRGFAFIEFADDHAKKEALSADQHEFQVAGKVVSVLISEGKGNIPNASSDRQKSTGESSDEEQEECDDMDEESNEESNEEEGNEDEGSDEDEEGKEEEGSDEDEEGNEDEGSDEEM